MRPLRKQSKAIAVTRENSVSEFAVHAVGWLIGAAIISSVTVLVMFQ